MSKCKVILKAREIEAMETAKQSHPLNPNSLYDVKRLGDAVGLSHIGFNLVTVMPGHDSTEYHRHLYEEECIYILSGCGSAEIEGEFYDVSEGDFLGFRRNSCAHALSNSGTEPLVLLVTGQRLEHDICEYPKKNLKLYINGEQEDYVNVSDVTSEPPKA